MNLPPFRNVADSINNLLSICTSSLPGQKDCDNAIRNIQSMKPFLDKPTEPINDMTYYECHNLIMEKSKSLGGSVLSIFRGQPLFN